MDNSRENWLTWLEKNWYEQYSLIILLPSLFYFSAQLFQFIFSESNINLINENFWPIKIASSSIITLLGLLCWLYTRHYPRRDKKKIGIVIAIRDNTDEAKKVKVDVVEKFQEIINNIPSGCNIDLLILKDFQAKKIIDLKTATKVSDKTNSQFIVWGKSIHYGEKYKFDLNYVVRHRPLKTQEQNLVVRGFAESIVDKNWDFLEKDIIGSITTTAQNIREIAWYVMGIASHLSYDFETSKKLHLDLYNLLKNNKEKRKGLSPVFRHLPYWLADTYMIIGLQKYYLQKDFYNALLLTNQALQLKPSHYGAKINKALYLFEKGDISGAKIVIKNIKRQNAKHNFPDSAWRYSEAFLISLNEKDIHRGIKAYQKAFNGYVTDFTLNGVIQFLEDYIRKNPHKTQFLYILGIIYKKKKNNLPMAMKKLEQFLEQTGDNDIFTGLKDRAKQQLREIYRTIPVSKNQQISI